ncbi:MAG: thioredoxin family protein [Candidatus Marinimicrobia bacterium]|nr:thioredoxin family protein [Candidatus Neomarinimicrobiota bacterium]
MAAKYKINAIPSLVIDGKVIQVGVPNENDLKQIRSNIGT